MTEAEASGKVQSEHGQTKLGHVRREGRESKRGDLRQERGLAKMPEFCKDQMSWG